MGRRSDPGSQFILIICDFIGALCALHSFVITSCAVGALLLKLLFPSAKHNFASTTTLHLGILNLSPIFKRMLILAVL